MGEAMKRDEYGEVINAQGTYDYIADKMFSDGSFIIGWTDGESTHYDILFSLPIEESPNLQGGLSGNELYVSIMRQGSFGFSIFRKGLLHRNYVEEKLNISGGQKVADLIDGVISALLPAALKLTQPPSQSHEPQQESGQ